MHILACHFVTPASPSLSTMSTSVSFTGAMPKKPGMLRSSDLRLWARNYLRHTSAGMSMSAVECYIFNSFLRIFHKGYMPI